MLLALGIIKTVPPNLSQDARELLIEFSALLYYTDRIIYGGSFNTATDRDETPHIRWWLPRAILAKRHSTIAYLDNHKIVDQLEVGVASGVSSDG